MSSLIQIETNRRNSPAPATLEGKSAVRQNAIQYGIHSPSLLIPGEDPAEFEALAAELLTTWRPFDIVERQYVDQLATDSWRLNRLRHAEAKLWDTGIDALERQAPLLDRVGRMIDRLQRSIRQITRDLDRLQALRGKAAAQAEKVAQAALPQTTEQSQFPTKLQRDQANWRNKIVTT